MIAALMLAAMPAVAPAAPPAPQQQAQRQSDPIISVEADDPAMVAAVREARAGLPEFWRRLAAPGPGEVDFAVKFNLAGSGEMIWVGDLRREAGRLTGALANAPVHPDYSLGQRVEIDEASIIDWTYWRGGTAVGHRTTRVLLGRMPAADAADVRRALGW